MSEWERRCAGKGDRVTAFTYLSYTAYDDALEEGEFDWVGFAGNLAMGLAIGATCIGLDLTTLHL